MTRTLQDRLDTELFITINKFKEKGLDYQSIQSTLIERSFYVNLDIKYEKEGTNNDT